MIIKPDEDDILIQPIEWISENKKYTDVYDGYPSMKGNKKFVIRAFGCTLDGRSVSVNIFNYEPFFYINIPDPLTKSHCNEIISSIKKICINAGKEWCCKSIVGWEIVKKKELYGFTNEEFNDYIKIKFDNSNYMDNVFRTITSDNAKSKGKLGEVYTKSMKILSISTTREFSFKIYEANLNPMLKFFHIQEIKPHSWIKIPAKCYIISEDPITSCNIDVCTRWDCIVPAQVDKIAPFIIACFDIECTSMDGSFPMASRPEDKIIQIGTTVNRYGEEVSLRHMVTLKRSESIDGCIVECYDNEDDLLMGWANFIHSLDPDVISGYNIFGFDLEYIWKRAEMFDLVEYNEQTRQWEGMFANMLSRITGMPADYKEKQLSSSGLGDNILKYINMHGRLVFDLFKEFA